jgi:endonuclease/exonuclease/phosphatase family metal-dependent hydrolase
MALVFVSSPWLALSPAIGQVDEQAIGPNEGVPVVPWADARQVLGRTAIVAGKIVDVGATPNGRVSFLNFSKTDRAAFKCIIFDDRIGNFPKPLKQHYENKLVTVRGIVTLYAGNPQIVLASPDQIQFVDRLPSRFMPDLPNIKVGSQFTIATFNILNLFDDVDDPYFQDETTKAKPREEMLRVAAVLRELNADVVAFQEVESRGFLKRFLDVFVPELGYRTIVHYEGNDQRGIDVCLASRIPVGRVVSHRHLRFEGPDGDGYRFNRDLLRVEMTPQNGDPFEVWVLHLKSNSGGRDASEPIRLAEARQVYKLVAARLKEDPNASLLLCGDFNDSFESPTLKTILGTDQGPPILEPLFGQVPEQNRVTYNREPYRSMIDFILVSPKMAQRYVADSYDIRDGTMQESGSDHNPVSCRFRTKASAQHATIGRAER